MIVKRQNCNEGAYTICKDQLLITKNNSDVEKKLEQIPLLDIAILLGYSVENIKENYPHIGDSFNYQTVKLFMDTAMRNLNYFRWYELISFNSALCIKVFYNPEKREFLNDSQYIAIPLAALILNISEDRMLNLAKFEGLEIFDEATQEYYMKVTDFLDYYKETLEERGVTVHNISLSRKNNSLSVLIERQLTQNNNEKIYSKRSKI